jgi:adenosylmethionine-8-amino-7-oxononanoate aminotransferase
MPKIQQAFVDAGVWIRPFGKLIYIMPPYIINEMELKTLTKAIFDGLNNGKHG